jgi:hypothetical protein
MAVSILEFVFIGRGVKSIESTFVELTETAESVGEGIAESVWPAVAGRREMVLAGSSATLEIVVGTSPIFN